MGVKITGFGHHIPDKAISNQELADRFGLTTDWIVERTGICERRYSDEATSDMIIHAAIPCLEQAGLLVEDVDCILVATMSPDQHCPATAAVVHHKLGTHNAAGFDLMAACSGFIYALQVGSSLINSRTHKTVLICAADKMSSIIDQKDRKTVLVFADGAGVCLLQYSDTESQVVDTICKLDSTNHRAVFREAGGSHIPATEETVNSGNHYMRLMSRSISTDGVQLFKKVILEFLEKNKLSFNDIDYIVPHQANKRMIESLAHELDLSIDKFIINIEYIGNTSAATIPLAISQALDNGKLKGNEKLLLTSVGAGFTYAAGLIELSLS